MFYINPCHTPKHYRRYTSPLCSSTMQWIITSGPLHLLIILSKMSLQQRHLKLEVDPSSLKIYCFLLLQALVYVPSDTVDIDTLQGVHLREVAALWRNAPQLCVHIQDIVSFSLLGFLTLPQQVALFLHAAKRWHFRAKIYAPHLAFHLGTFCCC